MKTEADRLTQPDWCNQPQPGNWRNACMRPPGHKGDHAVRKDYRYGECLAWPDLYPVRSTSAEHFPDLWHPNHDMRCPGGCDDGWIITNPEWPLGDLPHRERCPYVGDSEWARHHPTFEEIRR